MRKGKNIQLIFGADQQCKDKILQREKTIKNIGQGNKDSASRYARLEEAEE